MDIVNLLSKQTEDAYQWVQKLVSDIPTKVWEEIPENMETNITWQIGHLILSYYYHSVMVIKGHQLNILEKVPIQEYNKLFTKGAPKEAIGKVKPEDLLIQLEFMQDKSLDIINSMTSNDLNNGLLKMGIAHPIAKTKMEALEWNIKHTMWHCGQLAILKRILDKRYNFNLETEV